MRNLVIEITNEKLAYAQKEMGFTFDEAIEMMAISNGVSVEEVHFELNDEATDHVAIQRFENNQGVA